MNLTDSLNAVLNTVAQCNQAWVDNRNYEATLIFTGCMIGIVAVCGLLGLLVYVEVKC